MSKRTSTCEKHKAVKYTTLLMIVVYFHVYKTVQLRVVDKAGHL